MQTDTVAACHKAGASMAAAALECSINANLLRRWRRLTLFPISGQFRTGLS
jgi:transposase-like protein